MTNGVDCGRATVTDTGDVAWSSRSAELEQLRRLGLWLPGPVTALEVLDQIGAERAHQAYIAWLLDPRSPHGLGARVLTDVLRHFGSAGPADHQLSMVRVRKEVVQAQSRADIVVTIPGRTLVIELKVHSSEQRMLAKDIDPFNINKRPFFGVWAADPDAQAVLGSGMENRGWCSWAWWESIELSPPDNDVDLLYWCADVAAREVRRTWLDWITLIDRVAEQGPA